MSPIPSTERPFMHVYTQTEQGWGWLEQYRGQVPLFACILGFTETGLIPGISAAGVTPADRQYTAIADAEFLAHGPQAQPVHPLPPLDVGASPVIISRAVIEAQSIPTYLFNAGLPVPPAAVAIDLGGAPSRCLSGGQAMEPGMVEHLLAQGLHWGKKLAAKVPYLILGECVVGGTTTALAVLTGLGFAAMGKVNSSHPTCNHGQKQRLVEMGLKQAGLWALRSSPDFLPATTIAAAVGDPMQVVVAGMAIAASANCGVMLAGGTQMLAVYALARAIAQQNGLPWYPERIVVGTTRWVAEDPTGDTIGLAKLISEVPLIATQLSFATARYEQLRVYEQGYVKEGVGAGGCAIAAHLYRNWHQKELLQAIEAMAERLSTKP